ncbi:MAG: glycosyltransferase family 39 protein [Blastocatellia bacterium]|nr:glycosyltransferase family 39 protein [Blastocatellia bacterium]
MKLIKIIPTHLLLIVLSSGVSIITLLYFYKTNSITLYGDGVAHLNIARRIVDIDSSSFWIRYLQLGSPWLPLQHILMLPFIWNDHMWRSGLAGSFVSAVSYVLSTLFVYEIAATVGQEISKNSSQTEKDRRSGLFAAALFAFNPSILYLQATPMTELLFLASVAASVLMLLRWVIYQNRKYLILSAVTCTLASLTRYEAWTMLPAGAFLVLIAKEGEVRERLKDALFWSFLASCGPLYWFWHNWVTYNNPLEFYNGFYSAKGIYARSKERLSWADFTRGRLVISTIWAAIAASSCSGIAVVVTTFCAFIGLVKETFNKLYLVNKVWKVYCVGSFLFLPPLFTVYSLYTGNIQIYPLVALGLLNVRYGINFILAAAIVPIVLLNGRKTLQSLLFLLLLAQYGWLLSDGFEQLAVYQEPLRNNRNHRESVIRAELENYLRSHRPAGKVLMQGAELTPIVMHGGLNFRDIIFVYEQDKRLENIENELLKVVSTVICRKDDIVCSRTINSLEFHEQFELVYKVGSNPTLLVWKRKLLSGKRSEKVCA